jgi:hypothetical protein
MKIQNHTPHLYPTNVLDRKMQNIYPPLYEKNILDTDLIQNLYETDEFKVLDNRLYSIKGHLNSLQEFMKSNLVPVNGKMVQYDHLGGLKSGAFLQTGTHIDLYV